MTFILAFILATILEKCFRRKRSKSSTAFIKATQIKRDVTVSYVKLEFE